MRAFCNLFWLWTILGGVVAWFVPELFGWFITDKLPGTEVRLLHVGLGVIMLGMGMTLTVEDFSRVAKMPVVVVVGVMAQFLIMPLLGWCMTLVLEVDPLIEAGIILVSCCPGGTASNVICFLARANVALSVLMTMISTIVAVLATPYLTKLYASKILEVDAGKMVLSLCAIVLVPVLAGLLLNHFFRSKLEKIKEVSPVVSVLVIVLIVGGVIGLNRETIVEYAWSLLPAIFILHALGFVIAYGFAKLIGFKERNARTLSIEVGMQNSGLGSGLAKEFIAPIAMTPCAISAFYHCLIGAMLAAFWRVREPLDEVLETEQSDTPPVVE